MGFLILKGVLGIVYAEVENIMNKVINHKEGHSITFLKTSGETLGEYTKMRVKLYPTSDNPLHFHKSYTQEVKAAEGTVCIKLKGGERAFLQSGDRYFVQKSMPHAVINPSQIPIEYEITCRPGQANMEKGYRLKFELENQNIKPTLLDEWLLMDLRGTYPLGLRYKIFSKLKKIFLFKWLLYKRLDHLEKKVQPIVKDKTAADQDYQDSTFPLEKPGSAEI